MASEIREEDVMYGDVFRFAVDHAHPVMFLCWDTRHPDDKSGPSWHGVYLQGWTAGRVMLRRRGFRDGFWEKVE